MPNTKRLIKFLSDAIPQGPHQAPHTEWISVRLDIVQETIDLIDDLEKGLAEWRSVAIRDANHAKAAMASARVAIGHLQAVLNTARNCAEQMTADVAARDWLESIGSDPQ